MPTCILTDNSALLPPSSTSNNGHIRNLPLRMNAGKLLPVTPADFSQIFDELERKFNAILVLTISTNILPCYEAALQAAQSHGGQARISVLDSQQTGPGLGVLAQLGARAAHEGATLPQVEECIRAAIPHLYTLICPENDPCADTADKNLVSVYSLEEGCLAAYKKVRTRRHLLESFQEFIEEFEHPQQIMYFRSQKSSLRARPLREAVNALFPGAPFSELEINPVLATLYGSQTVGLTMMELPK